MQNYKFHKNMHNNKTKSAASATGYYYLLPKMHNTILGLDIVCARVYKKLSPVTSWVSKNGVLVRKMVSWISAVEKIVIN